MRAMPRLGHQLLANCRRSPALPPIMLPNHLPAPFRPAADIDGQMPTHSSPPKHRPLIDPDRLLVSATLMEDQRRGPARRVYDERDLRVHRFQEEAVF